MKLSLKLLAVLVSASLCLQASAATITVINTNDSGAGSLRQALADANDGDTIDFDAAVTGTITLTSGELLVNDSITISGPGANVLAVNGNAASRVFNVGSGKTVTISGLTISNGTAGSGGGIYNDNATLTINNSTLSGNSATDVNSGGGGIFNNRATLTINNTTLSGNSAPNADRSGGGIYNNGNGGSATLTINNSTLSGNSTGGNGGGIVNQGPFGSATLTINNSTLSGNSAGFNGGGIYNNGVFGSATLTIGDTILNAGGISNDSGTVTSLGYNLSSDDGGGYLTGTGDQINTDPMLDPNGLQDNGGPTLTIALQPGSPAIDMGDPNFTPPPNYDQRGPGYPRVVNGRIDKGSFEVQAPAVCAQGQGFWKNHPDQWPVTQLQLGNVVYSQEELLSILHQPVRGNGLVLLTHQEIAAKLNIANGADGSCIQQTLADADALIGDLIVPPVGTGYLRPGDASALADTLDQYNEGMLCAPACGDQGPIPTPTPRARPALHARPH